MPGQRVPSRSLAEQLERLLEARRPGLSVSTRCALRPFLSSASRRRLDHLRQIFYDLVLGVVDVLEAVHEQVLERLQVSCEQSHCASPGCVLVVGGPRRKRVNSQAKFLSGAKQVVAVALGARRSALVVPTQPARCRQRRCHFRRSGLLRSRQEPWGIWGWHKLIRPASRRQRNRGAGRACCCSSRPSSSSWAGSAALPILAGDLNEVPGPGLGGADHHRHDHPAAHRGGSGTVLPGARQSRLGARLDGDRHPRRLGQLPAVGPAARPRNAAAIGAGSIAHLRADHPAADPGAGHRRPGADGQAADAGDAARRSADADRHPAAWSRSGSAWRSTASSGPKRVRPTGRSRRHW